MYRSIRTRGRGERMGRVLSREIKDKLADWPTFSNLLPTITKRFDDECPIRSFDSLFPPPRVAWFSEKSFKYHI